MNGNDLRTARRAVGLTQQELARRFGCARITVWRWEHGAQPISPANALRLADVLAESHAARQAWTAQVQRALADLLPALSPKAL